jgi:ribosomal protein S18 acetylase RimI-like enzyme
MRLEALRRHPEAFILTYEDERAVDPAMIAPRFRDEWFRGENFIFGAFVGGWLVGAVGVRCGARVKQRHRATVWLHSTDPAVRGSGIGRRLLEDAIGRCREHLAITVMHLSVGGKSRVARDLYRRLGF